MERVKIIMLSSTTYIDRIIEILINANIVKDGRVHEEQAANAVWNGQDEIIVNSANLVPQGSQQDVVGHRCEFAVQCVSQTKDSARNMATYCDITLAKELPIDTWYPGDKLLDRLTQSGESADFGWIAQNQYTIFTINQ